MPNMNDQLILGGVVILAVLVIVQFVILLNLRKKLAHFTRGRDGASLEDLIQDALHTVDRLEHGHQQSRRHQKYLEQKLQTCVKSPSTLRFNPFRDAGSNQSFAASFLDESGNGVIISSLYAQGKTSVFAKPIQAFDSEYELTSEEDHVLQQAKNQVL